jgi:uncharacterized protein YcbK (DUF882 family)
MKMTNETVSRRRFLASGVAGIPLLFALPRRVAALAETRHVSFLHTHTGEALEVDYWRAGRYDPGGLEAVDHVLRDWRNNEVHAIDPALLDLLTELNLETGTRKAYHVISGYRSPATNAMLREKSSGVASRSLHLDGRAIDIRLPDVPLKVLRDAAIGLRRGGVGYYPGSNFVHVDTGRFRTW